jgi:PiT family inorganic phosphate transporter
VVIIFLTLAFEFSNGWHDAANSIATVVSTRVLTPFRAVAWAAFWNFIAAFVFGTAVAKTIGKGMVHIEMVDEKVLLAGLLGAIAWNILTLILGLPTTESTAGSAACNCSPPPLIASVTAPTTPRREWASLPPPSSQAAC